MGCIYRRGKTYWVKYYRNGKPFQESSRSDKVEVAKRLLKLREGEITQGKLPGICFERVKIDNLLEDLLTDYRINKKRSLRKVEWSVSLLSKVFGGMRAIDVDTSRIKSYIDGRLSEGAANATVNRELAALKRAFNLAVQCTPPKIAQVPYIPMLKENNVRKGFIEHEDYRALLEALPDYLKPVLTFAYFTGWRREEVVGLRWSQVSLKEGIVRLEPGETKNSEGRTLYMEPDLLELMKVLYRSRRMDCLYVFNREGKKIGNARRSWATACRKIGRPGLLFHDLRRSGVRNMVRAGIPERVAMAISGHKTRSVFDRYNIVSQEDLKEAARKRQEYCDQQAGQLQNGYNRLPKVKRVTTLRAVTP